jgi:molybdopterin converting factor small subunit
MPPFGAEAFGGKDVLDVAAGNIFDLVRALDRLSPGFGESAEVRLAFAVDGTITSDWGAPLNAASEVIVVPRVGGG